MTALATLTLTDLEQIVEHGLERFGEARDALMEIHSRQLYKDAGYTSFDVYCIERWGITGRGARYILRVEDFRARLAEKSRNTVPKIVPSQLRSLSDEKFGEVLAAVEAGANPQEAVKQAADEAREERKARRNSPAPSPSPEADVRRPPASHPLGASEGAPTRGYILDDGSIQTVIPQTCNTCAELRKALSRYGKHDAGCQPGRCSCGWARESARLDVPV